MELLIAFGLGFLVSSAIWLITHDFKLDWKSEAMRWKSLVEKQNDIIARQLMLNQDLLNRLGEKASGGREADS